MKKKMISKEEFVEIIERLRNYNDLQNKINNLFEDLIDNKENDFCNAGSICIGHETIVVELLKNMFNDKDTIDWWLYELDYGRGYKEDFIQEEKERKIVNIDLSNAEKLYDYLIENMDI